MRGPFGLQVIFVVASLVPAALGDDMRPSANRNPDQQSATSGGVIIGTWVGQGADNSWTTAANWDGLPPSMPFPDTAFDAGATASIHSGLVDLNANIGLQQLALGSLGIGAEITGSRTLTVQTASLIDGASGFVAGGGTCACGSLIVDGLLRIEDWTVQSSAVSVDNGAINLFGQSILDAPHINLKGDSSLVAFSTDPEVRINEINVQDSGLSDLSAIAARIVSPNGMELNLDTGELRFLSILSAPDAELYSFPSLEIDVADEALSTLRFDRPRVNIAGNINIDIFGSATTLHTEFQNCQVTFGGVATATADVTSGGDLVIRAGTQWDGGRFSFPREFPLVLRGGTLRNAINEGAFKWRSGEIDTFENFADGISEARASGQEDLRIVSGPFVNSGRFHHADGTITLQNPGTIRNLSTWNATRDSLLGTIDDIFFNEALFEKGNPTTYTVRCGFDNQGVVSVNDGSLVFDLNSALQFDFLNRELRGGRWIINRGQLRFAGMPATDINAIHNTYIDINGENSSVAGLEALDFINGTVRVRGGKQQTLTGDLENAGPTTEDGPGLGIGEIVLLNNASLSLLEMQSFTNSGDTLIYANGMLRATTGTTISGGELRGSGVVDSPIVLNSGGVVAPGLGASDGGASTVGTLTMNGDFAQAAGGLSRFELAGIAANDAFVVGATAQLGGTLDVALIEDFTPTETDQFTIVSAAAVTGFFDNAPLSEGGLTGTLNTPDGSFTVHYGATSVVLSGFTPALVGDMNCDGAITVSDIGGFVLALTDSVTYAMQFPNCNINHADANGDGGITVSDIGPFVALLTGA